jgi:hypothetical protein
VACDEQERGLRDLDIQQFGEGVDILRCLVVRRLGEDLSVSINDLGDDLRGLFGVVDAARQGPDATDRLGGLRQSSARVSSNSILRPNSRMLAERTQDSA